MSAARQPPAQPVVHAFAPSAADVPLLRARLEQLGTDIPVDTSPPVAGPGGVHGRAVLWSWTADGIERLAGAAAACHELDLTLLVGVARWVPLDTVLRVLAAAGLSPHTATPVEVAGRRGVELRLTRDEVAAPRIALALLELVTWSAPWHQGRQQPLRLAVAGTTPHDLRDHPYATDIRAVWRDSPAALRLASPEVLLLGEQRDPTTEAVIGELRSRQAAAPVTSVSIGPHEELRRPTLAAEDLLLAPHQLRTGPVPGAAGTAAPSAALLLQLAAGRAIEVPDALRPQLAPAVRSAAASPDLTGSDPVARLRASTRLRWSVLRHHSAAALAAALEARTGHTLAGRPRLTLLLDAADPAAPATVDATVHQLMAQRRRPDRIVLLTADVGGPADDLRARLQRTLEVDVVVASRSTPPDDGELVVVAPLDARLAADALADLELAHRLWTPTVSVIPVGFVLDRHGALHRTATHSPEGLLLPASCGVVAIAGRELRAHFSAEAVVLASRAALIEEAVERGGMILTLPEVRAVFDGTPATLIGARHLDSDEATLLAADGA